MPYSRSPRVIMARGVAVAGNFCPVVRLQRNLATDAERGAVTNDALTEHGDKLAFGKGIDLPVQRTGAVAIHASARINAGTEIYNGRHIGQGGIANVEAFLAVLEHHNTLIVGSAAFWRMPGRPLRWPQRITAAGRGVVLPCGAGIPASPGDRDRHPATCLPRRNRYSGCRSLPPRRRDH